MKNIMYHSTRDNNKKLTASQAVLQGLAEDGGLFVPEELPKLDVSIADLIKMDYKGIAYEVMKLFLTAVLKKKPTRTLTGAGNISGPVNALHLSELKFPAAENSLPISA